MASLDFDGFCRALNLGAAGGILSSQRAGVVDGIRVEASLDGTQSRTRGVRITAFLPHATDLRLEVNLAGALSSGSGSFETGDAAFDGIFHVRAAAREERNVARVLDAGVRGALCGLASVGEPRLDDAKVTSSVRMDSSSSDDWMTLVRGAVAVARQIGTRITTLEPPRIAIESGHAEAIAQIAQARGMAMTPNALALNGSFATTSLALAARWHSEPEGLTVRARFHEPIGVGLALRTASFADRVKASLGIGDLVVGDAAFDRAWTIRARDESEARAVLHSEARSHLDRLAATGLSFELGDDGLNGSAHHGFAPDALARIVDLIDGLRAVLRPAEGSRPYR